MIPNRHQLALDPAERLAESSDNQLMREVARATGNWPVLSVLAAIADERRRRKKPKDGKRF
jgi:hypothetical protein